MRMLMNGRHRIPPGSEDPGATTLLSSLHLGFVQLSCGLSVCDTPCRCDPGERIVDGHRQQDRHRAPHRGTPVAAGDQIVSEDRRRRPRHVDERPPHQAPRHQGVGGPGQQQRVQHIRHHEDRIQDDRQSEEDRLVDLEHLRGQRQPGDLAIAGVLGTAQQQRQRQRGAGAADIHEGGEKAVSRHERRGVAPAHGIGVGGQILQEDRRDHHVDGVVAIDADRPQQRDDQRIPEDPRQRVQRGDQRAEGSLDPGVDVDADREAERPERHNQHAQRHQRQERLANDRRHAVGHANDKAAVGERLLHPDADHCDDDRGEQTARSQGVGQKRQSRGIEADHQEHDRRRARIREPVLAEASSELVGDRRAGDDGQHPEGRGDRNLQQRQVRRDDRVPAGHRQVRDDHEEAAGDGERHDRDHPGANRRQIRVAIEPPERGRQLPDHRRPSRSRC